MAGGTILYGAMAAALVVPLKSKAEVDLHSDTIRVADVTDLGRLAPSERKAVGSLVIARVPQDNVTLSRMAVAALVRRRVPLLQPVAETGEITFRTRLASSTPEQRCVALGRPIRAGNALSREDLIAASCAPVPHGLLRFDARNGVLRAAKDLNAGLSIGRVALPVPPAVEAGSVLTLVSRVGPVQVTRQVIALQPGQNGRRIFVRDDEGHVDAVALRADSSGGRQ